MNGPKNPKFSTGGWLNALLGGNKNIDYNLIIDKCLNNSPLYLLPKNNKINPDLYLGYSKSSFSDSPDEWSWRILLENGVETGNMNGNLVAYQFPVTNDPEFTKSPDNNKKWYMASSVAGDWREMNDLNSKSINEIECGNCNDLEKV